MNRLLILKPCCIGDVIFATPLLSALRRAYPHAEIDWAVGTSANGVIRTHPALRQTLDTGVLANPAKSLRGMLRLVQILRNRRYDAIFVPDRSPLLGLAALLSGIELRVGLDSSGRGFGYTVKAAIDPTAIRHEAEIYLDLARATGVSTADCWANLPPTVAAQQQVDQLLGRLGLMPQQYVVIHVGGGVNAGMHMTEKRWPAARFAQLANHLRQATGLQIVLIGARSDRESVEQFKAAWGGLTAHTLMDVTEQLDLSITAALAATATLYIGNDTGVGHIAAAAGSRVLMIFGPSDPRRYGPFVPPSQARVAWRPVNLPARGVANATSRQYPAFDWTRDGITVDEVWGIAQDLLGY